MNRPARRDSGQSLALFAVMLSALIAFMALGIDAANLFAQRRDAQSVADLAALSGARSLPSDPATAKANALAIASANGYPSGVTATTPYGADTRRIEVTIVRAVPTFFMPFLGITTVDVGARAVAAIQPVIAGPYAIFAGHSDCGTPHPGEKTIDWSGSDIDIIGAVHSNDGVLVGGSSNSVTGDTTYVCQQKFVNSGSGNAFTPSPDKTGVRHWPAEYSAADFPCTYTRSGVWDLATNGEWWLLGTASSKVLLPGVYCATGSGGTIKLGYSDVKGAGVTFVATSQVEISGSNFVLTPHTKGVLVYSQGTSDVAVKVSASGGAWAGMIYAPNGRAEISGSSNMTLSGSIIADTVKLSGSNFTITAGSTSSGVTSLQLVE